MGKAMWIKILIGVAVVIVLLLLLIVSRPSTFHVERSITIAAPPERVFALVNDFRQWPAWSPWEKKDPNMKRTYGDVTRGVGGTYAWAGTGNVGEGKMTIERSERPTLVGIKLEFFKPFAGHATAQFSFQPEGDATQVTWSMLGESNFLGKAICLVMDMDKMIGGDFEKGLAGMKAVSESQVVMK